MLKKIGIVVLILLGLGLVRDILIRQVAVSVGSSMLGAPVKMGWFSMSLIGRTISINNLSIENPEGFSKNKLIDIAHVNVNYHPIDILMGKFNFDLIDVDIRQLAIEKNKQGKYNVSSLKVQPDKSQEEDKPLNMHIELLKLNVDRVTLRDASKGEEAAKEVNRGVGLKRKEFRNINSPQQLVALILFESSGLGPLKNMAVGVTKEVLNDVSGLTKGVAKEAGKTANSLLKSLKSAVEK